MIALQTSWKETKVVGSQIIECFERVRELNFYAEKCASQNEKVEGEDGIENEHFGLVTERQCSELGGRGTC